MYTSAHTTKKAQINLGRQHCIEFRPKRLNFPVQLSTGNREVVADDLNGYMVLPKLLKTITIDLIVYINFYLFLWLDFKCLCERTFQDGLQKKKEIGCTLFFLKVLIYFQNLSQVSHTDTDSGSQEHWSTLACVNIYVVEAIRASKPGRELKSSGDRHALHRQTLICLSM